MANVNTMLFVGIAIFSIAVMAPVALPLLENLLESMKFMPRGY